MLHNLLTPLTSKHLKLHRTDKNNNDTLIITLAQFERLRVFNANDPGRQVLLLSQFYR